MKTQNTQTQTMKPQNKNLTPVERKRKANDLRYERWLRSLERRDLATFKTLMNAAALEHSFCERIRVPKTDFLSLLVTEFDTLCSQLNRVAEDPVESLRHTFDGILNWHKKPIPTFNDFRSTYYDFGDAVLIEEYVGKEYLYTLAVKGTPDIFPPPFNVPKEGG